MRFCKKPEKLIFLDSKLCASRVSVQFMVRASPSLYIFLATEIPMSAENASALSLKQEQKKRSLQVVDLEHTNERFQALWGMVEDKGNLTGFDGDMFRKIVNRVTVDGKELTYDFGCGITITDSIE